MMRVFNHTHEKNCWPDQEYEDPLPYIGAHAAAASLLCFLAIAGDAFVAFRSKKLRFPCNIITPNASWFTLLGVAMKMPLDTSTHMPSAADQFAKLSSTALLGVVIASFMPSLGAMDNKEILMNIIALGIFVVTMFVNVCVQLGTGLIGTFMEEQILVIFFMLVLFVILTCSALTVPATKKYLELKYKEIHSLDSSEESGRITDRLMIEKLKK